MTMLRKICRDEGGATVIEMAIALPVLVSFIYGIFQLGVIFQANAGMQHALGEGARYATIWPTPNDANIKSKVSSEVFGTKNGTFTVADPVTNADASKTLSVTFSMPTNFLFMAGPTVNITRSKKVYIYVGGGS
jgi:Flp pilus assembly protein TadG